MPRQVAIVGSSPSSCDLAPFADPAWEIWGMAWRDMPRADRLFEVHDPARWPHYAGPYYLDRLKAFGASLTVRVPVDGLPGAIIYPTADVLARCALSNRPADIFTSSVAYMLGLALLELGVGDRIAIFGVDMSADDEWAYQRPATEYLIGLALGSGIAVDVPEQSALCRANFIYGADAGDPTGRAAGITETVLLERIDHYRRDRQATQEQINTLIQRRHLIDGHIAEAEALVELVRHFDRGGVIPSLPGAEPTA